MSELAGLLFEFFSKIIFYIVILKAIWSSLLFVFSFGYIPFLVSWQSEKMDRYGIAFGVLALSGIIFYFIFRNSYYFN